MSDYSKLVKDRADWLVDAVATATQNRAFLRGDPDCDSVAVEAILLNGEKAIAYAIEAQAAEIAKKDRIIEIQKHAIDRWCPCPDHRDKTPTNYCPVCAVEKAWNEAIEAAALVASLQALKMPKKRTTRLGLPREPYAHEYGNLISNAIRELKR